MPSLSVPTFHTAAVHLKWRIDSLCTPLTAEHWNLYRIIHTSYWRELGRFPNLRSPHDFNDKIQWLKLFDQQEAAITCSDKLGVRDHIRARIGENYLVPLLAVWDHAEALAFSQLPHSFVVKTNHDSGTVILVSDKSQADREPIVHRLKTSLSRKYGWENGEWAYSFIQPRILVEQHLTPSSPMPPPDYKFYVVEGRVRFVHFISDRGNDTKEQVLDAEGVDLGVGLYPSFRRSQTFSKPKCWREMVQIAEAIGAGFKCVRVDLFLVEDRVYAGEMTFWPMFGCYKGDGQRKLGPLLDFDRRTVKPPIYHLHEQLRQQPKQSSSRI